MAVFIQAMRSQKLYLASPPVEASRNIFILKRYRSWKSLTVTERYIKDSMLSKTRNLKQILKNRDEALAFQISSGFLRFINSLWFN